MSVTESIIPDIVLEGQWRALDELRTGVSRETDVVGWNDSFLTGYSSVWDQFERECEHFEFYSANGRKFAEEMHERGHTFPPPELQSEFESIIALLAYEAWWAEYARRQEQERIAFDEHLEENGCYLAVCERENGRIGPKLRSNDFTHERERSSYYMQWGRQQWQIGVDLAVNDRERGATTPDLHHPALVEPRILDTYLAQWKIFLSAGRDLS